MVFLINAHLYFFLAGLFLSSLRHSSVEAKGRKLKFCKIDTLFECFLGPLAFLTSQENGAGIPSNTVEYEQSCFNNHDYFPYCASKWLERCGSGNHLEIGKRLMFQPFQESLRLYCDSKGSIRSEALKHAHCVIQVKLSSIYRRECVRPLQANNEYIITQSKAQSGSKSFTTYFRGFCCAYNTWESCIVRKIEQTCGLEASQNFPYLIHHFTMGLAKGFCQQGAPFQPTNATQCPPDLFIAPAQSPPPIGYGSTSYLSHIFSYICPNIGWGLVPQRDY